MPRRLRVEYPGAIYHVMSRGDRRESIFEDDLDRTRFLMTLDEACQKADWLIHAYCLLPNHFHLVLETPDANLVKCMKWLLGTYTIRFNMRHRVVGHLFAGRYKAKLVSGTNGGYLLTACNYVHLNPAWAGLVQPEEPLQDYPWSSYGSYLLPAEERPAWLCVRRLFGELRIPRDSAAGRGEFARIMERLRLEAEESDFDDFVQDWCYGDEEFRQELLGQVSEHLSENHYGPERRESNEKKAERIVAEELDRRGWNEVDLRERRKGDPQKLLIALRLRRETTMTLKWTAQRLSMGAWTYLADCLRKLQKQK